MSEVESLGADAHGALRVGLLGGAIFVESGRVCWAAAPGLAGRLTDLLRVVAEPPMSPEQMEALFRACRRSGRPLGETLLEHGRISPLALGRALLAHSAEAVTALAREGQAPTQWVPHAGRGYDARFSFFPAHLLVEAAAHERFQPSAHALLASRAERDPWALAFGLSHDTAVLLAARGAVPRRFQGMAELSQVARWASREAPAAGSRATPGRTRVERCGEVLVVSGCDPAAGGGAR